MAGYLDLQRVTVTFGVVTWQSGRATLHPWGWVILLLATAHTVSGRSVHCTWAEVCGVPVHALLVARNLPLGCVSASTGNAVVVAYVLTLQGSLARPARAPHTSAFVIV